MNSNLHKRLNKYAKQCDELFLNDQLKDILKEASNNVTQIEPEELYIIEKDFILVDVREPEEFASGYINSSTVLTIPRGKLEFMAIEKIAKKFGTDIKIVTYCFKGPRGSLAALQLQKMGFTNVVNLEDGLLNWLGCGKSLKSYFGDITLAKNEK